MNVNGRVEHKEKGYVSIIKGGSLDSTPPPKKNLRRALKVICYPSCTLIVLLHLLI